MEMLKIQDSSVIILRSRSWSGHLNLGSVNRIKFNLIDVLSWTGLNQTIFKLPVPEKPVLRICFIFIRSGSSDPFRGNTNPDQDPDPT